MAVKIRKESGHINPAITSEVKCGLSLSANGKEVIKAGVILPVRATKVYIQIEVDK